MSYNFCKRDKGYAKEAPLCSTCRAWPVRPGFGRIPGQPVALRRPEPAEAICVGCGYSEDHCTCAAVEEREAA